MTPPAKRPRTPAPEPLKKQGGGISDRTANIITIAVATLWVAAQAVGLITSAAPQLPDVQPPQEITAVFMVVVGGAFLLRNKGKDD